MKFQAVIALALAAKTSATSQPCRASCASTTTGKECIFEVTRDRFASELGYFKFSGESGDCGGTNPTLGIEKGATYYFIQSDTSNYYHALGFANGADGALDDQPELEPGISSLAGGGACEANNSCPAPMYIKNGQYLGDYSNNDAVFPESTNNEEDFGLDAYEPEFFYPILDWVAEDYQVSLFYPETNPYEGDFFYFCHIHQFMTGRVKFIDSNGDPLTPADEPAIPYDYQVPSAYDESCGTFGLDEFQLPNDQCPKKFVCNSPGGPVGKFAECVDSMNCAMLVGMTTNVNENNAIGLFNHQMIPHHENAINMCKSLLNSGEADCADLEDEDDPACAINVICEEIINVQNAQIQTMRGVLDSLNLDPADDCNIHILKSKEKKPKKTRKPKTKKPRKTMKPKNTPAPVVPPTEAPVAPPSCAATDPPTSAPYEFESQFVAGSSSVSYGGQIARHVLMGLQKNEIGTIVAGGAPGAAEAQVLLWYDCPGTVCETSGTGIGVAAPLTVAQATIGDISTGKNLNGKIAGNDAIGQHKDWDTQFVGWNDWGSVSPQSPENLVRRWAAVVEDLAQNVGNDPDGNPITKVFVSAEGQDYQQLIQKFVLGAVAFSQGADDYLDNDTAGKGLNAQNNQIAKAGVTYSSLEHAWDEGYGYFGGAINFLEYTDDEIAKKGGRPEFSGSYNDFDGNTEIDLKSEKNFGHSLNAAKRDRGAATGCVDLTSEAYNGFYQGRKLITEAGGDLSTSQMADLVVLRDGAIAAWEKAIAATVVHYINDCIFDIAQPTLDFYGYAKHWSEAKGFALSFQFNRLSPVSDADFVILHGLLRDAPELDSANFAAWEADLLEARDLLEAAYGFDSVDVASW